MVCSVLFVYIPTQITVFGIHPSLVLTMIVPTDSQLIDWLESQNEKHRTLRELKECLLLRYPSWSVSIKVRCPPKFTRFS